jgi:CRISPR-associated endonuclease/helicase Cas3
MIMKTPYIAHVLQDRDGSWSTQSLRDHLNAVAKQAGEFASAFDNQDWGELLGYWHDIGKYLPAWQKYIRRKSGYDVDAHIEGTRNRPNHSTAGAVLAFDSLKQHVVARLAAYEIGGHHAGLPDWYPDDAGGDLQNRIYKNPIEAILNTEELDEIRQIPEAYELLEKHFPQSAPTVIKNKEHLHLWVRMLFSCLVDADFLDTANFMNPEQQKERGSYLTLSQLKTRFDVFMQEKKSDSDSSSVINKNRDKILGNCRQKGKCSPGFFSLNVPTGGGKTLSSIAFALEHALKHNKKRIIVAIPYTSIIEQTAKVFKYGTDDESEIQKRLETGNVLFGEDQIVEHHSNLDPDNEDNRSRLASENWDAPIVVTTNVQLFESLFASRTSSCRKLHNLVNSIIILDEAQMLPPEYLKPILSVLRGLVEHFGVTVVLMTATQPALEGKIGSAPNEFEGLTHITHIIDDPELLAKDFQRVEIRPPVLENRSEWEDIALELQEHEQVLCIVNTRSDCRKLHGLMPIGTIHLSAFMCGEERSEVISKIKSKLKNGEPIRVISTQLVEAGVDIDFPAVYRALAGLDSIAQAAGRCNRENRLAKQGKLGKVIVFNPPKSAPMGMLRKGEDACKTILRTQSALELTPTLFKEYFKHFYVSLNGFDIPRFHERLVKEADEFKFQFRTLAQNFQMIDDSAQRSILVWYKNEQTGIDSQDMINKLRFAGPSRELSRRLQRFIVNVPVHMFNLIQENNYIEEIHGYWVQCDTALYKSGLGLLGNESDWVYGDGVA